MLAPLFTLTVRLTPEGEHSLLAWAQSLENVEFVDKLRDFATAANEQKLDRLEAVLHSA